MVIKWAPIAKQNLQDIYQFYLPETGRKKALEIVQTIKDEARYLLISPGVGQYEMIDNRQTAYRYIVKRHWKLYYTIENNYIRIAFVWDTRQDPQRLRCLLK
ncbi:type II toxin-antitoxin system RelE/ParE family toxin [Parabacteroides sp. AF17-28]|uniref:type II toxin-antitoxin system RelE/ParE family toxin n=1 Tax=Parabacteroides sp. AF17-28 TaxID=2292241 RepID=UPI000EFDE27F|nr:type II toxin-antitoxin system RelE/ParE family toxin [Parabacteroides sp. AF17-28]RHR58781.1 type II toxin-antitoxin system RelE/ParE family toxin [Parabacteroides sp. AF17-28]